MNINKYDFKRVHILTLVDFMLETEQKFCFPQFYVMKERFQAKNLKNRWKTLPLIVYRSLNTKNIRMS